jgi:hypothetical protein
VAILRSPFLEERDDMRTAGTGAFGMRWELKNFAAK